MQFVCRDSLSFSTVSFAVFVIILLFLFTSFSLNRADDSADLKRYTTTTHRKKKTKTREEIDGSWFFLAGGRSLVRISVLFFLLPLSFFTKQTFSFALFIYFIHHRLFFFKLGYSLISLACLLFIYFDGSLFFWARSTAFRRHIHTTKRWIN